jgi:hypothetical protein
MWIRKTDLELKKPKDKDCFFLLFNKIEKNPILFSIIMFAFIFIFIMFVELFIGVSHGRFSGIPMSPPIKFNELPQRIPFYFRLSFLSAIFVFIIGYLWRKKNIEKKLDYVCDKCNKLVETDNKQYCECGGEFIHIDKMKWINED